MRICMLLAIILILIFLFLTISIKIQIKNLKVSFPKIKGHYTNKESEIFLMIYLLKKIRVAKIDLKKMNLKNKKISNKLQQKIKKDSFNFNTINYLKNSNYILEEMNLKVIIGTEDAALTAIAFGILNIIIGNLIKGKITNMKYQKYEIIPKYNTNVFKVKFDGIFTFKMANIIGIIKYLKKRSVDKNGRTSYRRSYAYSNE